ncbi:hypothetical protein LAZ29_11010 [Cereibacter sphaeroides]|uniref:hypothetical protein n=1 Tax=Rhodobacterales TaxID=204455 RepID=UPI000BBF392B|nr:MULTISPECIES: hypothetical protein [Paracoccaceae]MCE6951461.1 hypothetical protein [Cereibacter sphaeroides]
MFDLDDVLARFPERANDIRRLCLKDTHFRSICEDLGLAYRSRIGSGLPEDAGRSDAARELRALRDELEIELLAYLNARSDARSSGC